jgi:hypothetical protein
MSDMTTATTIINQMGGFGRQNKLFKNNKQRVILHADSGVERWWSALVAAAIVRRVRRDGFVTLHKSEIYSVRKIHEVLRTGIGFENPFQSLAIDLQYIECTANQLGFNCID